MIQEIKEAYEELAKVVNFKCLGCGKCGCLTDDDTNKKIMILMREEVETLIEKDKMYGIIPVGNFGYLKIISKRCAFLNEDNKCDIHEDKPIICLLHPFQVFMTGFVFGGGMIFDTKCSCVIKNRKKLDNPSKKVLEAYNKLYLLVLEYKKNKLFVHPLTDKVIG